MFDSVHGRIFSIGLRSALLEVRTNRVRSFLSLVGVALSMGATTSMVSFLTAADVYLKQIVEDMGGSGSIQVAPKAPKTGMEQALFGRSRGLRLSDADSLNLRNPWGASAHRAVETIQPVVFRSTQEALTVRGVDWEALETREKVLVDRGRFFTRAEYAKGERVCVIGWKLAEEAGRLLKNGNSGILGRTIRIGQQSYVISGVFTKKHMKWERPGYTIYIPLKAMLRDFTGNDPAVPYMDVRMTALSDRPELADSLTAMFRRTHRGVGDIVLSRLDGTRDLRAMMLNLKITFLAIIIVSMAIGSTNIVNLMLSTLSERVAEIGLRKSLGATRLDILAQFLVESLSISLVGGAIGCLIGMVPLLATDAVEAATGGLRPQLDFQAFLMIFLLTVGMGVFSGLYPAIKGAVMNPVDALRCG